MLRKLLSLTKKNKLGFLRNGNLENLEKCHRVHCQCVARLQKAFWSRPGFSATSNARDEYKKCLQLSKKWHQKWPL